MSLCGMSEIRSFKDRAPHHVENTIFPLYVPEELLPDAEGILIGGGRCFTPFPKTDVWTSGEIPSP